VVDEYVLVKLTEHGESGCVELVFFSIFFGKEWQSSVVVSYHMLGLRSEVQGRIGYDLE
jgi:hypothetical protein